MPTSRHTPAIAGEDLRGITLQGADALVIIGYRHHAGQLRFEAQAAATALEVFGDLEAHAGRAGKQQKESRHGVCQTY